MMAPLVTLAWKSLYNRRSTAILTVVAIALSVALLLGVEKVRTGARESFANTISATDLIVGARSGQIQLLLYSVFRIGNATNNVSWESYRDIADWPGVAWTVPLSLGDSHRGFRVLGTTPEYFEHYRYGYRRSLAFAAGEPFSELFDAVVGADVARELGYDVGDEIVVAHGLDDLGLAKHEDKPFRVSGVLEKTGTPVDRTVHVSLEAIEAIHVDWAGGAPPRAGQSVSAEEVRRMDLKPKAITAFLVGLDSRLAVFGLQRRINTYREEPLLAILPGVTLQELWDSMGGFETTLLAISVLVVGTGFMGMIAVSLGALNERRREMAILRSVGARPAHVFGLLVLESGILAALGTITGLALLYGGLFVVQPLIETEFGLYIPLSAPSGWEMTLIGLVTAAGFVSGAIPAYRAYRNSLADGMMVHT